MDVTLPMAIAEFTSSVWGVLHDVGMVSRARRQPNRTATRAAQRPRPRPLRIVIAVTPQASPGEPALLLEREVRLARAAMLYADTVEIISPAAEFLGSMQAIAHGGEAGLLGLISQLNPATLSQLSGGSAVLSEQTMRLLPILSLGEQGLTALARAAGHDLPEDFRQALRTLNDGLGDATHLLQRSVREQEQASGILALQAAIAEGVVTLHPPGYTMRGADVGEMTLAFVERIRELLRDAHAHALRAGPDGGWNPTRPSARRTIGTVAAAPDASTTRSSKGAGLLTREGFCTMFPRRARAQS